MGVIFQVVSVVLLIIVRGCRDGSGGDVRLVTPFPHPAQSTRSLLKSAASGSASPHCGRAGTALFTTAFTATALSSMLLGVVIAEAISIKNLIQFGGGSVGLGAVSNGLRHSVAV